MKTFFCYFISLTLALPATSFANISVNAPDDDPAVWLNDDEDADSDVAVNADKADPDVVINQATDTPIEVKSGHVIPKAGAKPAEPAAAKPAATEAPSNEDEYDSEADKEDSTQEAEPPAKKRSWIGKAVGIGAAVVGGVLALLSYIFWPRSSPRRGGGGGRGGDFVPPPGPRGGRAFAHPYGGPGDLNPANFQARLDQHEQEVRRSIEAAMEETQARIRAHREGDCPRDFFANLMPDTELREVDTFINRLTSRRYVDATAFSRIHFYAELSSLRPRIYALPIQADWRREFVAIRATLAHAYAQEHRDFILGNNDRIEIILGQLLLAQTLLEQARICLEREARIHMGGVSSLRPTRPAPAPAPVPAPKPIPTPPPVPKSMNKEVTVDHVAPAEAMVVHVRIQSELAVYSPGGGALQTLPREESHLALTVRRTRTVLGLVQAISRHLAARGIGGSFTDLAISLDERDPAAASSSEVLEPWERKYLGLDYELDQPLDSAFKDQAEVNLVLFPSYGSVSRIGSILEAKTKGEVYPLFADENQFTIDKEDGRVIDEYFSGLPFGFLAKDNDGTMYDHRPENLMILRLPGDGQYVLNKLHYRDSVRSAIKRMREAKKKGEDEEVTPSEPLLGGFELTSNQQVEIERVCASKAPYQLLDLSM